MRGIQAYRFEHEAGFFLDEGPDEGSDEQSTGTRGTRMEQGSSWAATLLTSLVICDVSRVELQPRPGPSSLPWGSGSGLGSGWRLRPATSRTLRGI